MLPQIGEDFQDWLLEMIRAYRLQRDDVLISWEAYIDESGVHSDSPYTVTAMAFAKISVWGGIIPRWATILREYHVEYFHAAEVNARSGQFDGWSREYRDQFVAKLLDAISGQGITFCGYILEPKLFELEIAQYPDCDLSIYDYLLWNAIVQMGSFIAGRSLSELQFDKENRNIIGTKGVHEASIFIEAGCNLSASLTNVLMKMAARGDLPFTRRIVFESKALIPLQVADLLAYDFYKQAISDPSRLLRITRPSLQRLDNENIVDGMILTREWLQFDLPGTVRAYKEKKAAIERFRP